MSKFLLAFHGGKMPENPEAMQEIMTKWGQWMESLGKDVIDPGSIVGNNHCLAADGNQAISKNNQISGYMLISSNSMETALATVQACPILANQGTIEVAELMSPP